MPYRITQKEIAAVSALAPSERFEHFVKRVADWEEIWGLQNQEGWALSKSSEGREVASFWPHSDYAKACALGKWANYNPVLISLPDFLGRWLPGLEEDGRLVSVFETPLSAGVLVEPTIVSKAITEEIGESYGDDL